MLFARGQWAVFGIEASTMDNFQKALTDPLTVFEVSQLAASITTKFQSVAQTGITPYGSPRLDETLTDTEVISSMSEMLTEMDEDSYLIREEDIALITENLKFIGSIEDYSLGNNKYGFWMVSNEYEDPTDPASKKEQIAYTDMERPFKFLVKEEKKSVEERVLATSILNRSQFPVLVDFQHGRVYVASSNADDVNSVNELLAKLGAKTFPLVWDFGTSYWPSIFLNKVAADTHFRADFKERADQLAKLPADAVEKLEDKQMEKIVNNFFALSKLDSEVWVGLTTPSKIRIHKPIDAVGVAHPSVAYSLLNMSNDAEVASAGVVFQEVVIKNTKVGEKLYRNDLFTIDINDNVNLQEAGAAMLRGFDLPQFKKEVKTTIKAKGRMEPRDYWYLWLDGIHNSILEFIDNVTDVLEIDKAKYGLLVPDYTVHDEVDVNE
jgi:hypothetical protein